MFDEDYDKLEGITEERFFYKSRKARKELSSSSKIPFKVAESPSAFVFDSIMYQGFSSKREDNDSNIDYFLDTTNELRGIKYYMHKYFDANEHAYTVFHVGRDGDAKHVYKNKMESTNRNIVLRVFACVEGILDPIGDGVVGRDYLNRHIIMLENDLHNPPLISLADLSLEEWVDDHQLKDHSWKVADVDNFMGGNPFFKQMLDMSKYKTRISDLKKKELENPFYSTADSMSQWRHAQRFNEPLSNKKIQHENIEQEKDKFA